MMFRSGRIKSRFAAQIDIALVAVIDQIALSVAAHRAYRYRFYPSDIQKAILLRTIGSTRFVYNWALDLRTEQYKRFKAGETEQTPTYKWTSAELTKLKKTPEYAWLNEVSSVPLQQALRHLESAFKRFWNPKLRAKYPCFKKKKSSAGGSAEFTKSGFRYHPGRRELTLAKIKSPLKIRWSRKFKGEPSTVTVSLDAAGRWHISILVAEDIEDLVPRSESVGIDVGITHFATLSTGEKIDNPRHLRRAQKRLAKAQRSLSRKKKGSANKNKARILVARIHARVVDARKDFLHKLTTRLVRENQAICVESLNVSGMMKNRKLAKSIADASWSEFFRQLAYKAKWYGRHIVEIDRFFPSSKTCSACGRIRKKLLLSARSWVCDCGVEHDRDINAAKNIKAAGLAVLAENADAYGGSVSRLLAFVSDVAVSGEVGRIPVLQGGV